MKKSNAILIIQLACMYLIHLPLYVVIILVNLPNVASEVIRGLLIAGFAALALMIPICILSLIFAGLQFARLNTSPLKTAMIVKLCLIPWYILNFLICAFLIVGFLNPWLMIAIPLLIAFEILITYIFMLSTSIHSIAYTIKFLIAHKTKPNALIIVALIFHFFFCLDVVGAIILTIENKKYMQRKILT